jgi:hypothetical protein
MLAWLAACCLASALAAFEALRARERRLVAGEAGLPDLAAWTGLTDRRGLLGVPGVREQPDGGLRFDPRYLDRLPAHPIRSTFDCYTGNGLCVAVSLGALGCGLGGAAGPLPGPLGGLLALALVYQLLGRLWSAAVWLELRGAARD